MSVVPQFDPLPLIAAELGLPSAGVAATARLLEQGATVPFIARYRKEATGGLDEVQIRTIEERRAYLEELDRRRRAVLASIAEQGKLTGELQAALLRCTTKTALEDLYLPFKPRRRTRATMARERGLLPLAERILAQPRQGGPLAEAAAFVDPEKGVADGAAALAGARDIVAERMAEHAAARTLVREALACQGLLVAEAVAEKTGAPTKFEQYYAYAEKIAEIPSHRFLAVRRGEEEGVLRTRLELDASPLLPRIEALLGRDDRSPFAGELRAAIEDGYHRLLLPSVETDVRGEVKERSDRAAVEIFASNLRELLLAAPLGAQGVVGIDPGLRTGCKCAALDVTGRFVEAITIYPGLGAPASERAGRELLALLERHRPFAVAIGNGTGGRETEAFVRRLLAAAGLRERIVVVQVNEAGASVYSASELARSEHPELDVTVRGAISIGRRLQDPLAELVKIDPQAIGVGQYQHDVPHKLLERKLDEVVESCVNHVGVELNTASAPLLARVAGIGPALSKKIVRHREEHGPFPGRSALLGVSGLGPRTFEQAAGFLRVRGGEHPLDASAVHPERYILVERMARELGIPLPQLVGNAELVRRLDHRRYIGGDVGAPTLHDILAELTRPGRDPRQQFEPPRFRDDVLTLEDVRPGMELESVVTNVTAFGAFVDVGVHHDGLVHVSQLADRFVRDPHEVVRAGDRLKVRVLEVDLARRRLSLSARSPEGAAQRHTEPAAGRGGGEERREPRRGEERREPRRGEERREPRRGEERQEPRRGEERREPRRGEERGRSGEEQSGEPSSRFGYNPFRSLKDKLGSS